MGSNLSVSLFGDSSSEARKSTASRKRDHSKEHYARKYGASTRGFHDRSKVDLFAAAAENLEASAVAQVVTADDDSLSHYQRTVLTREALTKLVQTSKSHTAAARSFYDRGATAVSSNDAAKLYTVLKLAGVTTPWPTRNFGGALKRYSSSALARQASGSFAAAMLQAGHKYECAEVIGGVNCGKSRDKFGRLLSLDVDHIDGDPTNSVIENLQFLCGDCHKLRPTSSSHRIVAFVDLITLKA
jgi:hypothetical protein